MHSAKIKIAKNPSRPRRRSPLTNLRSEALHADVKRGHFLRPNVKRVTTSMIGAHASDQMSLAVGGRKGRSRRPG
jgi:hypothetical protein